MRSRILYLLFSIGCWSNLVAQKTEITIEKFHVLSRVYLQNNGKWYAVNPAYDQTKQGQVRYFGYEFTRGIHDRSLKVKLSGYFPSTSEWMTFGEGYYTWDPSRNVILFNCLTAAGEILQGESERLDDSAFILRSTSTLTTGKKEVNRYVHKLENGAIKETAYRQQGTQWQKNMELNWLPLPQPSGTLCFMSTRDGNFEVYSMNANGEKLKNLSCNRATDYSFSATKDGQVIFYSDRDGNNEIYIQDSLAKKTVNLSNNPASDRVAVVSPDGKKIAFTSDRDHKEGELYVMNLDGSDVKRLTQNELFEDAPNWSPDGNKLVFSKDVADSTGADGKPVFNGEIFIMDADGKNQIRLTNRKGFDGGACFSPDGKKIAYYGKSDTRSYEIYLMDADGKNAEALTDDPREDYSPSWSPDGEWIGYTSGDSKNYDVWVIHIKTRIKFRLTTQPKRDESPFWLPGK